MSAAPEPKRKDPKDPQPIIPTTPPPGRREPADPAPDDEERPTEPDRPSRPHYEQRRTRSGRMRIPSPPDEPEIIDRAPAGAARHTSPWGSAAILHTR